eukprot:8283273-Lingulodinium_polyedra.AAC.1
MARAWNAQTCNLRAAAATARESHARALRSRVSCPARAWNAQTRDSPTAAAADGRIDRIVAQ